MLWVTWENKKIWSTTGGKKGNRSSRWWRLGSGMTVIHSMPKESMSEEPQERVTTTAATHRHSETKTLRGHSTWDENFTTGFSDKYGGHKKWLLNVERGRLRPRALWSREKRREMEPHQRLWVRRNKERGAGSIWRNRWPPKSDEHWSDWPSKWLNPSINLHWSPWRQSVTTDRGWGMAPWRAWSALFTVLGFNS